MRRIGRRPPDQHSSLDREGLAEWRMGPNECLFEILIPSWLRFLVAEMGRIEHSEQALSRGTSFLFERFSAPVLPDLM